ncbi:DUF805 domain-containing protein [Vibrio sp. 05-20-BW147]|uniref:DUF805 domain-containing protein n=1 Tax=Vibrio sp. 05-20-BW147 TaxID=2575834 RepID=UPI0015940851|nr:DUF805 domain-containing protein [Vibrio sp. 05-20-BW147]NVC64086.1 DUF805 domain-containing protein [Vibrio sp. 05-20-BW147]
MSLKELLFSFQGRIGRKTYWLWNLCYYLGILGFVSGVSKLFPSYSHILLPIFLLVILIPDLAVTTKRWHDRNKSVYWLFLNIPLVFGRLATPMSGTLTQQPTGMETIVGSIALLCGAWILLECGFLKGTEGPNRYGEPEK